MACVFCGNQTIEHEHILAGSVKMLEKAQIQAIIVAHRSVDGKDVYSWRDQRARTLIQEVCGECRGGWMSEIERDVSHILGLMMTEPDLSRVLLPQTQTQLARWVMKTALLLDFAFPGGRVIPDGWYKDFFAKRLPPETGALLWTSAYSGPKTALQVYRMPVIIEDRVSSPEGEDDPWIETRAFVITITAMRAVFQVLGHFGGDRVPVRDGSAQTERILRRLWPNAATPVVWPPNGRTLNDMGLTSLAGRRDFTHFGRIDTSGSAPTVASYQFPEITR